jgi:hypothetical protein
MSNDTATKAYIEIMRLVNEQDAQSGRFKADVQERMVGMMRRQANAPDKPAPSQAMSATQDQKSYIANYVRTIQQMYGDAQ